MKKFVFTLIAMLSMSLSTYAQELIVTEKETPTKQDGTPWYINLDYSGYEFEIPAGSIVDKGPRTLVKYPDGSFGVSVTNEEKRGCNQKTALTACTKLAESLGLPKSKVEKVKIDRVIGAKASGTYQGSDITVMVLPYNNEEVSLVLMGAPNRRNWMDHFMESLKHPMRY